MTACPVCGADDRPVLADWCCGAGGAGRGYQLAGFHVVGYDTRPQPHYPGCFVQADAMAAPLDQADAYHASPPCVDHLRRRCAWVPDHGTAWLVYAIRGRLRQTGRPWVMECVPGAPVRPDYQLCGCLFGLGDDDWQLVRERWFETSWHAAQLRQPCHHTKRAVTIIRQGAFYLTPRPQHGKRYIDLATASAIMGVDWPVTKRELGDMIPPAYTAAIGADLAAQLAAVAA